MSHVEDAPCTDCGKTVHLQAFPPCECGDVYCDFHACPMCLGCYICQPENPDAAEEGCARCDNDFWQYVISQAGGVA